MKMTEISEPEPGTAQADDSADELATHGRQPQSPAYPYAPYPSPADIRADNLARGWGTEAQQREAGS